MRITHFNMKATMKPRYLLSILALLIFQFSLTHSAIAANGNQTDDPSAPAMTAMGESMANPKPPVILIADPNINLNRVPPPRQFQLRAPKTATININFLPAGSPDALWGDVTIAWPAAASAALTYAAGIWESLLNSTVPITINAGWVNNLGSGVLGHSGSVNINRDFSGAPTAGTWYPATLANALAGSDLNPSNPDIYMGFSSTFSWYTGTDGNTPITDYDLVSVVLHEICHGLGFAGSMTVSAGQGSWGNGTGYPISYDRFTEDNAGVSLLNTTTYPNPSVALGNALTSGSIFFDGTAANAANGGSRVPLYVPGTWQPGSSYSHLSETYNGTANSLMTYSLGFGESEHSPGPITEGLLSDVGWPGGGAATYTLTVQSQDPNSGVAITVSPLDNNSDGNGVTAFTRVYNAATAVTLTAPATAGGNNFDHWELDSVNQGSSQTLNLTMNAIHTAKAVYTGVTPADPFNLTKVKCIINWKAFEIYSKGNLLVSGWIPVTVTDLGFLENSTLDHLLYINHGVYGQGADYFGINKKKTVVKYIRNSDTSKFKRLVKLKLKKGNLYVLYKTKYGTKYAEALGITNTDTAGWQSMNIDIDLDASYGANTIIGTWNGPVQYSTKQDKKSVVK